MISMDSLTDHILVQQQLFQEQHTHCGSDRINYFSMPDILGSLSLTIMSFIAQAQTSKEAWTIVANTYAKPSRGRIK
jgi:hypothetical protein